MVYDEPCTIEPDGTLFDPGHPKNASETLCVGTNMNNFPISDDLKLIEQAKASMRRICGIEPAWLRMLPTGTVEEVRAKMELSQRSAR